MTVPISIMLPWNPFLSPIGNKSVWDFAGDGWVHRLVLQESNPPEELVGIGMGSGSKSAGSFAVEEGGGQGQNHVALLKAEHNMSGSNKDDYRHSHSNNTDYSNDSGCSSSSTERHIRVKLVEIPDPTNNLAHRPRARAPPLSSGQTELEVNRLLNLICHFCCFLCDLSSKLEIG